MSKIKNAIEYYDIFLDKYTKDEAVEMLVNEGFHIIGYDEECNLLMVEGYRDPVEVFLDIQSQNYRLVW